MVSKHDSTDQSERANWTLGKLLAWHLFERGTQPDGSRRRWKKEEFAEEVDRDLKTIENWLRNQHVRDAVPKIERALLGDSGQDELRNELREHDPKRRRIASNKTPSQAPAPVVPPGVPSRNLLFIGRSDELKSLHEHLARRTERVPFVLSGMPGSGKTSLAAEYIRRFGSHYQGVWWCRAETRDHLLLSLQALAADTGIITPDVMDAEEATKIAFRWLAQLTGSWLLVYDNVPSPQEIADLLPPVGANVLITSRYRRWNSYAKTLHLDVFSEAEALTFLREATGRDDRTGARQLANVLDRLPLALDHAAATCDTGQLSFAEYASRAERLIDELPSDSRYPKSVFVTFTLAIDEAAKRYPAARALMFYLACCSPDRIPLDLLAGTLPDETARRSALQALDAVSLIKSDPFLDGTPAIIVHRLVQAAAKLNAQKSDSLLRRVHELVRRLFWMFDGDDESPSFWLVADRLSPHVLHLWRNSGIDSIRTAEFLNLVSREGLYLKARGLYDQALPVLRNALAIARESERADLPTHLANLGALRIEQGDYPDARRYLEEAVELVESDDWKGHPNTSTLLSNLAAVLVYQNAMSDARELLERAMALDERDFTRESTQYLTRVHNLATLYQRMGSHSRAQEMFDELVPLRESALGVNHPLTAATLLNRGNAYEMAGAFDRAQEDYLRGLSIYEENFGPQSGDVAYTMCALARIDLARGNFVSAKNRLEQAMDILRRTRGAQHPNVGDALSDLARVYEALGDHTSARTATERAAQIFRTTFGEEHRTTVAAQVRLARAMIGDGEFLAARKILDGCLENSRDHEDLVTALCLDQLGIVNELEGRLQAAADCSVNAASIREKILGPNAVEVAKSMYLAGTRLASDRQFTQALGMFQRALQVQEHIFGDNHDDTMLTLNRLGSLLSDMGDVDEAKRTFHRGLDAAMATKGPDHIETARALINVGDMYLNHSAYSEARAFIERAIQSFLSSAGSSAHETSYARMQLARVNLSLGETKLASELAEAALSAFEKEPAANHAMRKQAAECLIECLQRLGEKKRVMALRLQYGGPMIPAKS